MWIDVDNSISAPLPPPTPQLGQGNAEGSPTGETREGGRIFVRKRKKTQGVVVSAGATTRGSGFGDGRFFARGNPGATWAKFGAGWHEICLYVLAVTLLTP